ncbi:MAG: PhnD/SsuA/transferrin family substrate-binding protein [Gammaproteobacteria bacterium]|jgi:phosphonate transport system substrate-binding protein|nr:PhnD/SsuA/transferrin family substrate-binding protein [Gammaproteobacteria bacterium]
MNAMARRFLALILSVSGSVALADNSQEPLQLDFGIYTTDKPTTMVRKIRPILDEIEVRLADKLERPVSIALQVSTDYTDAIDRVVDGRVDFARLEQSAYIKAKTSQPQIKVLAVEGDARRNAFKGHIVVREQSAIRTLEDLRGMQVAFAQPMSASDRYIPQHHLVQNGIELADLAGIRYLDRQDVVASAVERGAVDAGAISEGTLRDQLARGTSLRVISDYINPTQPWVASSDMPRELSIKLREVLISMRGVKVLELIKKDCFIPGADSNFRSVRAAIEANWKFTGEPVPSLVN